MATVGNRDSPTCEQAILDAWHANAEPWLHAVRGQTIASRVLVTDRAILEAVCARHPRTAIDLGCGEGWLVRALASRHIDVLGVDAVDALVQAAKRAGPGRFLTLDYAAVAAGALTERADVVVCNFSLLGGTSVDALLRAVPRLLTAGGVLIVQTLHPLTATGLPYRDGWRDGSWDGCGECFGSAAPWYFRTMGSWLASLSGAGLQLTGLIEPLHPHDGRPVSMILVARIG